MRSAGRCSRNDVPAKASVLLAAAGGAIIGSAGPDITVGLLIAVMFVSSAVAVIRDARRARRLVPGKSTAKQGSITLRVMLDA